MELEHTILITQARTGSTRLPNKVLLKIGESELLKIHLDRIEKCKEVNEIIVATTLVEEDQQIVDICNRLSYNSFRGSEEDVLDRYYQTARSLKPKWVVRVTSDCPLIDPELIDAVVKLAKVNDVDYVANILEERFPDGQDIEVFKFSALEKAWHEAALKSDREHVTPYIRTNSTYKGGKLFKSLNFPCHDDFSNIRMTVDEPKDFELVKRLVTDLGPFRDWRTYTTYIQENKLNQLNEGIVRNEGFLKSLKND